jgi:hypothetical protein
MIFFMKNRGFGMNKKALSISLAAVGFALLIFLKLFGISLFNIYLNPSDRIYEYNRGVQYEKGAYGQRVTRRRRTCWGCIMRQGFT